jgi:hypothetical protein
MLISVECVHKLEPEENKIKWAFQIKHIIIEESARHQNLTQLTTVVNESLFNDCHRYMTEHSVLEKNPWIVIQLM